MDKSEGRALHYAAFGCEFGNGTLSKDPNGRIHTPITLTQLKQYVDDKRAGKNPLLPPTADVSMEPGKNHELWWTTKEFWLQMELAMDIFEHVFDSPANGSRYVFVPVIDWSQGHAGMAEDGLNAENMTVGPARKTAKHLRHTFFPDNGSNIYRAPLCQPGCKQCLPESDPITKHPGYQSVGVKGLRQVLSERGMLQGCKTQADMVKRLQTCDDFQAKNLVERAHVTDMLARRGHEALFGVKYHAELAWIEAKWCWVKNRIRKHLDGSIETLYALLKEHWPQFKVDDARKQARKCREVMSAYQLITDVDGLCELSSLIDKQRTHRKPVALHESKLLLHSGGAATAKALLNMKKAKAQRDTIAEFQEYMAKCAREFKAKKYRQRRAGRSQDEREKDNERSVIRKRKNDAEYDAYRRNGPPAKPASAPSAKRQRLITAWAGFE